MKKTPLELQEKRYGERRKNIKWLLGIVLLITVTVVVLGLWASLRRRNRVVDVPAALPKNVSRQLSGYTFTRSEEGRQIFTIHATRTLAYEGARTVLEGVHVIIYGPAGNRHDEITTDRCQYDNGTGALACTGKARMELQPQSGMPGVPDIKVKPGLETGQPLILETSDVSYDPRNFTLETPNVVNFNLGAATGAAEGLAYNTRSGGLKLRKNVSFKIAGAAGPIRISAGGLVYSKREGQISLNPPVSLTRSGGKLTALAGVIFLNSQNGITHVTLSGVRARDVLPAGELLSTADHFDAEIDPDTNQIRGLSANGDVKIEDRLAEGGGQRLLTAESVTLAMAEAGYNPESSPQSAMAQGDVKLVLDPGEESTAAARGRSKRVLTAPKLFLTFQPGGLVKEADTSGHSVLQLIPTDRRLNQQTLTAGKLQMAFDTLGRIGTVLGFSSTRIVDQPSPLAPNGNLPRISSADDLTAHMDPATGALKTIQQMGHYSFQEGNRRAIANDAVYDGAKQQLTLSGNPEVWDPQGRIRAQHMVINFGTGAAKGWGKVQSIYFDLAGAPVSVGIPHASSVGEGKDEIPVIVQANRVSVDKLRQTARYEGNVRAWRGADVVESPSLEIDLKQRRLSSGQGVVTSLIQPGALPGTEATAHGEPEGAAQPVTIRASKLDYFDFGREAVYEGNVRMVSANTTFQSNRLEVYFSQTSHSGSTEVERAIADGNVRVTQEPGRRATGRHAEYFAAAGKIVLTGGPPVVYDQDQGYLTGKRLTFFIHDASLFADGGNRSQTLSKRRIQKQ